MNLRAIRRSCAGLLVAAGLVVAVVGIAHAGFSSEFEGSVRDGDEGRIGLDREKRAGKPVLGRVLFDFATECQSGDSMANGSMSGFVQVRKGRFEAKRDGRNFGDTSDDDEVTVTIEGKVVSKRVIKGTIRVKELRREGMNADSCNTGKRTFRVDKVGS